MYIRINTWIFRPFNPFLLYFILFWSVSMHFYWNSSPLYVFLILFVIGLTNIFVVILLYNTVAFQPMDHCTWMTFDHCIQQKTAFAKAKAVLELADGLEPPTC